MYMDDGYEVIRTRWSGLRVIVRPYSRRKHCTFRIERDRKYNDTSYAPQLWYGREESLRAQVQNTYSRQRGMISALKMARADLGAQATLELKLGMLSGEALQF